MNDVIDLAEREWLPEGPEWTTSRAVVSGHRCRQRGCDRLAVAALNRGKNTKFGRQDSWWCYCDLPDHLYGRRVVDGRVEWPYVVGSPAWERAKGLAS